MRTCRVIRTGLALGLLTRPLPVQAQAPAPAPVQDPALAQALRAEIAQLRKDFEARLAALEARLSSAGGAPPAEAPGAAPAQPSAQVPAGAEGAGGPSGTLPVYGNVSAASKIFNPDMAVIGNFIGVGGKNDVRPEPALAMREAEASFQAIVDPYARADFFIAFGEEGVDLEEGYITFPTLPGGILMKVGKLRAAFGRVNTFHSHQLPWPDRPLVTENLVGGEEGIADAGLSFARLIPNRWMFLEATGQVFRGDSGDLFTSHQRQDLSYVGRLRGYQDISESTNIDVGGSYARGHNPSGALVGRSGSQPVHDDTLRRRRDPQVAAAPAVDLSLVRRPLGARLEPARAAGRAAGRRRLLCVRRLPACPPLVRRRAPRSVRSRRRGGLARQRRLGAPDLLAERVQPDPRPVPEDDVRRRPDGERVPVPVPILDWGARRPSVLA